MSPSRIPTMAIVPQSHAEAPLDAPPIPDAAAIALFADLDGTLAPIEETPDQVGPDRRRRRLLDDLAAALEGRLAILSGRSLADLDRVLEGRVTALAAVHGLVRRQADGKVMGGAGGESVRRAARDFAAYARDDPRLLVEDKGLAVALHFRRAPDAAAPCLAEAREVAERTGLILQEGDQVVEVRRAGPDKGEALAAFMAEAPFAGHQPVFLGDDLTDEAGFRAASRLGGFGVVVGARRPTAAAHALADITAAAAWLAAIAARR
ncbi:MAG: trehalose-phosphatase [Caulobacteraceae bacterium]